jgi:hypothetical protein
VENPKGNIPPGRPECWLVNNIKMDFREIGWGGSDSLDLAQYIYRLL